MARNDKTAALVDGILNFIVVGGSITAGLLLPNLLIALDKPLAAFDKKMSKRARERELRRVASYMRYRGLIKGDYEHGLTITKRGRQRLAKFELEDLNVKQPVKWDRLWRVILYDIPENNKYGRDALTRKLRSLGFYQLQRSVWLHPFPCLYVIRKIAIAHDIETYITYIKTGHVPNQKIIVKSFQGRYTKVKL